jgi:hypothetical protein
MNQDGIPRRSLPEPVMSPTFIGIDVSKGHLDLHVRPSGHAERFDNTSEGVASITTRVVTQAATLVVIEATGGYETLLAASLGAAGVPVAVVNPRQVRRFAEACGQLAKTDAIDAAMLALFAERIQPPVRPLPDPQTQHLQDLLDRRRQLIGMRTMEKQPPADGPDGAGAAGHRGPPGVDRWPSEGRRDGTWGRPSRRVRRGRPVTTSCNPSRGLVHR